MAVNNKDFKVKHGLIVEGTTGTINGYDILTKNPSDDQHIIDVIGGEATPLNTPDTVVKRDGSGNFAAGTITANLTGNVTGDVTGDVTGNADTATALETARTIELTGDVTGSVSFDGTSNVQISATIDGSFATDLEVADAKQEAIDAAATDATTKANNAQSAAEDYADGLINDASNLSTEVWSAYKTSTEISLAESDANDYTDTALESYTPTADLDATIDGYGYLKSADLSGYATESYVNTAVDNLVDGAPGLLDTLNEIAAAINDDENYATTITTALAGKQGTLTPGDNISIVSDTISVTGLMASDIGDFTTAAQAAGVEVFDPFGAANAVSEELNLHTAATSAHGVTGNIVGTSDSQTLTNKTIDGTANTISNIDNTSLVNYSIDINGYTTNLGSSVTLDTDDVAEGSTNLYYTTSRAKTDAADLLTNATLTNITITGTGSGLTITAEDGIAGKTTDDLGEGEDNLYFTDQRAIDALENTTPTFSAVDINSVAKQVAGTTAVPVAGIATAYSWPKADYRSAEFLVKVAQGGHTQVSKVLVTLQDNDNVSITEYGIVETNVDLGDVSVAISGNDVQLKVTTANNTSTLTVVGTLLV